VRCHDMCINMTALCIYVIEKDLTGTVVETLLAFKLAVRADKMLRVGWLLHAILF
jgi:hypothetical protein